MYKIVKKHDGVLISAIASHDWVRYYSKDVVTEDSHGLFVFETTKYAILFLVGYVWDAEELEDYELWSASCEDEIDSIGGPTGTRMFKKVMLVEKLDLLELINNIRSGHPID